MGVKDRIIVALDVDDLQNALELVGGLKNHVGYFKVGLQLIYECLAGIICPELERKAVSHLVQVRRLFNAIGEQLFMDTKLNDIPNTLIGASRALAKIKMKMFNFHASSGILAMAGCVDNQGGALALAVTILTSLGEDNAHLIFGAPSKAKTIQFARDAVHAGANGIVCSPLELKAIGGEKELGNLITVVTSIRPDWAPAKDQKRTGTPTQAIKDGANYLVVGRPITDPPQEVGSPVQAASLIAKEIESALKTM